MSVGVDDAERVMRAFRDSRGWSHERRIRVLKALLARTEAERRLIDQLAQFLFVDAPREGSTTVLPKDAESASVVPQARPGVDTALPSQRHPPISDDDRRSVKRPRNRWIAFGIAGALLVAVVWGIAQWNKEPRSDGLAAASAGSAMRAVAAAVSAAAAEAAPAAAPGAASASPAVSAPPAEAAVEPTCPREPQSLVDRLRSHALAVAVAVALGAALWLGRLGWRKRRGGQQEKNVRRIADSAGPRVYRFDVPPDEPVHALEPSAVREAAFQLSAPRREVSAPWVAPRETVEATVRNLGLVLLRFARWKEQTSLLVLEDVSASMVKWPCHGEQLVSALRRQGGEVAHYFFERSPGVLYESRELEWPTELDVVLCAHPHSVVIAVSDAAGVEPGYGAEPQWSRLLGGCIWLHPAPEPLWGRGARWLAARHRVVAMSPEGLLRLGAEDRRPSEAMAPPWLPPRVLSTEPAALISAWRGAVTAPHGAHGAGEGTSDGPDESAFWLLCAGALLEQRAGLTVRLLAALREDVVPAPWEETERLWHFPGLSIGSDGTLHFVSSMAECLVDALRRERPELLEKVVDWATKLVEAPLRDLQPKSLAALFARMTRLRLDAESQARCAQASKAVKELLDEGFGDALSGFATSHERRRWGRIGRVAQPTWLEWVASFLLTLGAVALSVGVVATHGRLLEQAWPREPRFAVATAGGAWHLLQVGGSETPVVSLPPGSSTLYVCEQRRLESGLSVWVDGKLEPGHLVRSSTGRPWDLGSLLKGRKSAQGRRTFDLAVGYRDEPRAGLKVEFEAPAEESKLAKQQPPKRADSPVDAGVAPEPPDAGAEHKPPVVQADEGVKPEPQESQPDAGPEAEAKKQEAPADAGQAVEANKQEAQADESKPIASSEEQFLDASAEQGRDSGLLPAAGRQELPLPMDGGGLSAGVGVGEAGQPVATATAVVAAATRKRRMLPIPAGTFQMGSNDGDSDEKPVHSVPLPAFWMDEKEVTTAQYAACVSARKCTATSTDSTLCNWGKADRANHPINCVDWNQATAYCVWEGKRLPTEEEWEYAARGTDGRSYPWGNTAPTASLACWSRADGTCPVGSLPDGKSPFGLFDMAGNVWEWTSSPYCDSCGAGWKASIRVYRGGCWFHDVPLILRAANRDRSVPSFQSDDLGFRCARSPAALSLRSATAAGPRASPTARLQSATAPCRRTTEGNR